MGELGGLSTPRQAPIRAGHRKTTYSNLQERLKFFVVDHRKTRLVDKLSFPFCGALGGPFEGHLGAFRANLAPKTHLKMGSEVLQSDPKISEKGKPKRNPKN